MTSDGWVPQACTLPTAERPLRVAEFDELFASGLLGVERVAPTHLRLVLEPALEVRARDLAARETACCSFFEFAFTATASELLLDVVVPPAHVDVLDALAAT
jgi:hypothetical protein